LLHNFGSRESGEGFNEQVNMGWLHGYLNDSPPLFFALGFYQGFTVLRSIASENRLSSFGCPHPMIDHEGYPMFVSLVTVVFHREQYIPL
jgi:hypothetical protein